MTAAAATMPRSASVSGLELEFLTPASDGELIAFLDAPSAINFSVLAYHYPFYRDMLSALGVGQPVYLGARRDGELIGFLPAFRREADAGVVYSSLPFFGPNAGVLCSENEGRIEVHTALLRALIEQAGEDEALSCSVYTPFLFDEFALYDAIFDDAVVVDKFTHYLDLSTAAWSASVAYDIRKARNAGLEIVDSPTPEQIAAFYDIYVQNCREFGIPQKPQLCIDLLLSEDIVGRSSQLYVAVIGGQVVAGLLVLWSVSTLSYYMPCTLSSVRSLQPGSLLIDHAVARARERGIRIWNWESSPSRTSGVAHFKRKWGSLEASYRIYVQALRPPEVFARLGATTLAAQFPYFFVYPFDRLPS